MFPISIRVGAIVRVLVLSVLVKGLKLRKRVRSIRRRGGGSKERVRNLFVLIR